ncbi:MAG: hypothetical protein L0Z55_05130 [Planctomycetes bacterium]|nr:hypothetical protein [Planctomycetota bacterium]
MSRERNLLFENLRGAGSRILLAAFFAGLLAASAAGQDTQGPERTPEDGKTPALPAKPEGGPEGLEIGKKAQPGPDEIKVLVDDITNNMRKIEDLLNRKESGSSCQNAQRDTLAKIDKLIELAGKG